MKLRGASAYGPARNQELFTTTMSTQIDKMIEAVTRGEKRPSEAFSAFQEQGQDQEQPVAGDRVKDVNPIMITSHGISRENPTFGVVGDVVDTFVDETDVDVALVRMLQHTPPFDQGEVIQIPIHNLQVISDITYDLDDEGSEGTRK